MKWLLSFILIVRVTIPLGVKETYEAKAINWLRTDAQHYCLVLKSGKELFVPTMFTVIEEK